MECTGKHRLNAFTNNIYLISYMLNETNETNFKMTEIKFSKWLLTKRHKMCEWKSTKNLISAKTVLQ